MAFRHALTTLLFVIAAPACQGDWWRFRGPNGSGVSTESAPTPSHWSPGQNVAWKADLPGAGVSSPIVVDGRVFVTCYSGYGLNRQDPGEMIDLRRHLVCLDADSGKTLWRETVKAVLPEDPYTGIGVTAHGYASHTPVTDGKRVYAFFGKSGVHAFDLQGKRLWQKSVGTGSDERRWGSSSSPILHDQLLIITASAESRSLVGLNKMTGQEVWKQETDGLSNVWGTPILVEAADRTDLVLGVPFEFWGLNPKTGELRWFAKAMNSDQYSSSVIESNGVLYGIEGRGGGSIAVRAGGRREVSESHTIWTGNDSSRFGTPIVVDGRLYYFASGVANCIDLEDGSTIFKGRLPGTSVGRKSESTRSPRSGRNDSDDSQDRDGLNNQIGDGGRGGFSRRGGIGRQDYASAVAADGKIYFLQSDGTTHVLAASESFRLIASNKLTESSETFGGTPAISGGKIYIRSNRRLYCISN